MLRRHSIRPFPFMLLLALLASPPSRAKQPDSPSPAPPSGKPVSEQVKETTPKPTTPRRGWLDIAPKTYPDLRAKYHRVPRELNALPLVLEARKAMHLTSKDVFAFKDYLRGKSPWDEERWKNLIEANANIYPLIRKASRRPWFQMPLATGIDSEIQGVLDVLRIVSLLEVRIVFDLKHKRSEAAMESLEQMFRLAHLVMQSDGTYISFLAGTRLYQRTFAMARVLMQDPACTPKQCEEIAEWLGEVPDAVQRFRHFLSLDFFAHSNTIVRIANGEITLRQIREMGAAGGRGDANRFWKEILYRLIVFLELQPNKTVRDFADAYRYIIRLAETPVPQRNAVPRPACLSMLDAESIGAADIVSGNAVGHILFRMAIPALLHAEQKPVQFKFDLAATRTLCALRRYADDHDGQLPASLAELIPKYLPAVPSDPYDGQALRYSPEKRRIWSVGENGKDEGGLDAPKPDRSSDFLAEPTIFIKFPGEKNQ